MYKLLRFVPLVGRLIQAANAYAADGRIESTQKLAPLRKFSKLAVNLLISGCLALSIYFFKPELLTEYGPGAFIRDSYADILGFAIGAYALFFIIPASLINLISTNSEKLGFGPEIIPAEMYYPLVVLTVSWSLSFFLQPFEERSQILAIEFFLLSYGFLLILELIGSIYISSVTLLYFQKKSKKKQVNKQIKSSLYKRPRKNRKYRDN